jgi:hypothetical protein
MRGEDFRQSVERLGDGHRALAVARKCKQGVVEIFENPVLLGARVDPDAKLVSGVIPKGGSRKPKWERYIAWCASMSG